MVDIAGNESEFVRVGGTEWSVLRLEPSEFWYMDEEFAEKCGLLKHQL